MDTSSNRSALVTLTILEHLVRVGERSLGEISKELKMNKSTLHRFLAALVQRGYVVQRDSTRNYAPTMKILTLASHLVERFDLREHVRPIMNATADLTGETVHLGLLEGTEVVYIDKVEGRQAVKMASRVGSRVPGHASALGKVLLASRRDDTVQVRMGGAPLAAKTRQTITDLESLAAELERVREQGYAIDDEESEDGIRCVAAPVRDRSGAVVAALSVSGWIVSMTAERVEELIPVVRSQADRASEIIGGVLAADVAS